MGVVVALGPTAEVGKIQRMMDEADAGETPLQHQLDVFGKYLSIITIIVAFLAFFLAWKGRGEAVDDAFAIAVGTPCCCTIVLCMLK
jgi:magnesium-transporting ATPase (P-type)